MNEWTFFKLENGRNGPQEHWDLNWSLSWLGDFVRVEVSKQEG